MEGSMEKNLGLYNLGTPEGAPASLGSCSSRIQVGPNLGGLVVDVKHSGTQAEGMRRHRWGCRMQDSPSQTV